MATAFRRQGRAEQRRYLARLDADERELLATLMEQVAHLLEPPAGGALTGDERFDAVVAGLRLGAGDDAGAPGGGEPAGRDPALDRLLPSAHREDEEVAAEFRRLTEGGLRHRKAAALTAAAAALHDANGDEVALDTPAAHGFLTALTDVRLVLGERLGLRADEDLDRLEALAEEMGPEEPLAQAVALYDFLSWLQETLASALIRR